jgi:hypothetical protein
MLALASGPEPRGEGLEVDPGIIASRTCSRRDLTPISRCLRGFQGQVRGSGALHLDRSGADLQPMFATSPSLSPRRVVLIDAVDDLERSGANALLKNLEEPPTGTIFLLVSHAPGRLLPTIRSRCRLLRSRALDDTASGRVLRTALPESDAGEIGVDDDRGEAHRGRRSASPGWISPGWIARSTGSRCDGDATGLQRLALAKTLVGQGRAGSLRGVSGACAVGRIAARRRARAATSRPRLRCGRRRAISPTVRCG